LAAAPGQAPAAEDARKSALSPDGLPHLDSCSNRKSQRTLTPARRNPARAAAFSLHATHGRTTMADDVDAEAERAANAARASVKRAAQRSNNFLPILVMIFAILSLAALVMTDKDVPQTTQPRVETPSTTQGN
jgi:hypothetical protein